MCFSHDLVCFCSKSVRGVIRYSRVAIGMTGSSRQLASSCTVGVINVFRLSQILNLQFLISFLIMLGQTGQLIDVAIGMAESSRQLASRYTVGNGQY